MLTTVAVVPDHQVCIPDIGGEAIQHVEGAVNGLMKLAIKLHAEKTDLLVCVTSGLPLLHHRLLIGKAKEYVRFFASNTTEGREIHMKFPGAVELYTPLELMITDQRVPVEGYVQEGNMAAIDDKLLSFLFYCHSIEWYPQIALIGISDLSPAKHHAAGKALGRLLDVQDQVTSAVILTGDDSLVTEMGAGVMSEWDKVPDFRLLGESTFEERTLKTGYFRHLD